MLRLFLKDSIIYTVPAILSKGISFLLVPLYTRVLSPADYGSLELFLIFASIIYLLVALEVSQGVARFYSSEKDKRIKILYASTAFWFTIFAYSVFFLLMFLFSDYLSEKIMGQYGMENEFRAGLLFIWLNGILLYIQNQLRWELKSVHYFWVSASYALVTALASIYLAYIHGYGLYGILVGMTIGCLFSSVLGLFCLRKTIRLVFSKVHLIEMLNYSFPLVFSVLAIWLTQYVDRIMINKLLSIHDVGIISVGYKISAAIGLVTVGFQGAFSPLVLTHYKDANTPNQIEKIFRYFIFCSLFLYLVTSLFATELVQLLTQPQYYEASSLVVFVLPAILLSKMYIFAPGISIAKKTHILLWVNIAIGILNIILNLILIPLMDIKGAALATLFSFLVMIICLMYYSQRYYYVPHNTKRIISLVTLTFIITVTSQYFNNYFSYIFVYNMIIILLFIYFCFKLSLAKSNEIKKILSFTLNHLTKLRSVN